jgi:hypothetical protein
MEKKVKGGKRPAQDGTVHPETQPPVRQGVADANSSKTHAAGQPDARSNHDKDGNSGVTGSRQERR